MVEKSAAIFIKAPLTINREFLINRRVRVQWDDKKWYHATVVATKNRKHSVRFDNNETADLRLVGYELRPKGPGVIWELQLNEGETISSFKPDQETTLKKVSMKKDKNSIEKRKMKNDEMDLLPKNKQHRIHVEKKANDEDSFSPDLEKSVTGVKKRKRDDDSLASESKKHKK